MRFYNLILVLRVHFLAQNFKTGSYDSSRKSTLRKSERNLFFGSSDIETDIKKHSRKKYHSEKETRWGSQVGNGPSCCNSNTRQHPSLGDLLPDIAEILN